MRFKLRLALLVAVALVPVSPAMAQQTVDPGRIDERLRERAPLPSADPVDVPELPGQEAAPESGLTVVLTAIRFEGATVIPVEDLDALAAPYLNREMPLAQLFQLAEAVTAEYRRRGYVLSRAVVGPQRIEGGVATIQIVEGFIDQTRIEGDAGGYRPFLESYLRSVQAGRPTSGDDLSRALLLARDLQGADVRAVLTPSATTLGAADLSLVVERTPIEAVVAIDNRGSRWLGPVQVYGAVVLHDPLGTGGRLAVTGVTAPDQGGELGYVSGTYDQPIGGSGLRASGFVSYVRTRPGDELRLLDLEGESFTWGLGMQYPFVRSREGNLLGRLTFESRDSESTNLFLNPIFKDKTRSVSGELLGNVATPWGALVSLRVAVTQGLDAFGATAAGDPSKSRATASGEFTSVNIDASWVQSLSGGLHLMVSSAAQITSDSLLASEEFGVGGQQFGRAYDPSEITGDEGYAGKVEVFYTIPASGMGSVEPFAYYEAGRVFQNDPLPGEALSARIRSAGVGLRANIVDRFGVSAEYAKPIGRDVAALGDRDGRIFLSFNAAF